jgi:hypothetical protein
MLVSNLEPKSHLALLRTLLEKSDEAVLVSPFLFADFSNWVASLNLSRLRAIRLVTTLAPRGSDQLTKPRSLQSLIDALSKYWPNVGLTIQIDNALHGKIYLFKTAGRITDAIVTSANLTNSGLRDNHEWGVQVTDEGALRELLAEIDEGVEYLNISPDLVRKMVLFAEHYARENPGLNREDIDASLLNALKNAPRKGGGEIDWPNVRNVFLKPWGTRDNPVLKEDHRPFSEPQGDLDFPKGRPADVGVGDIVVCFGTGSRCVVAVYRVLSSPDERPKELQERDEHARRWPWYAFGENCTARFGSRWWEYDLTIDRLSAEYLSTHPGGQLSAAGSGSLGAFNFGAGRLRLDRGFGRFAAERILAIDLELPEATKPRSRRDDSPKLGSELRAQFHESMLSIYKRAREEAGYTASKFLELVSNKGGFDAARILINSPNVSDGYTELWRRRRLDLTVEAFVLENAIYYPLFTAAELEVCRTRLGKFGYVAK